MERDRSRSRDQNSRLRRHVLQCVPPELDLGLSGLYHFCTFSGTGIPQLALFRALQILWDEGIRIQYRGGYRYEVDSKCNKMYEAINAKNPLKTHPRGDISAFVRDISGVTMLRNSKALTTIASPCTKISQGILNGQNLLGEVGPHSYPSSLIWTAHAGVLAAAKNIEQDQNIVIAEMVPAAMSQWEVELDAAFGKSINLNANEGAERKRRFRTSPEVDGPISQLSTSFSPAELLLDGSIWPGHTSVKTLRPPTLRSIYPHLLDLQAVHNASSSDVATLQQFLIKTNGNELRYAGPAHLAQWLELPQSTIMSISHHYPCEPEAIDPCMKCTLKTWLTKGVSPPAQNMFHKCGVKVLCKNCSEASELLGRAWNYSTAVSIITATLRQAYNKAGNSEFTPFKHMCPHFCVSPCPFVHTLEQAKGRSTADQCKPEYLMERPVILP